MHWRRNYVNVSVKFLAYLLLTFFCEVEETLTIQPGRLICLMARMCIKIGLNGKKLLERGESSRLYLINTNLGFPASFSHWSLQGQKAPPPPKKSKSWQDNKLQEINRMLIFCQVQISVSDWYTGPMDIFVWYDTGVCAICLSGIMAAA